MAEEERVLALHGGMLVWVWACWGPVGSCFVANRARLVKTMAREPGWRRADTCRHTLPPSPSLLPSLPPCLLLSWPPRLLFCSTARRWVPITYTSEVSWQQELWRLLPTLLLIGGYVWFTRRQLGGLGGMGEWGQNCACLCVLLCVDSRVDWARSAWLTDVRRHSACEAGKQLLLGLSGCRRQQGAAACWLPRGRAAVWAQAMQASLVWHLKRLPLTFPQAVPNI